jgi:TolB-like protein/Tfp pilus assembly protein PilF
MQDRRSGEIIPDQAPPLRQNGSVSAEAVERQLERILSSPTFVNARQPSRFLRHVVQTAASGNAGGLKEYSIGVDVFDRDPSFDPRLDSIVRVEATRLRRRLKDYYAAEGRNDPIQIQLPAGGYAPLIEHRAGHRFRGRSAWLRSPNLRWIAAVLVVVAGCLGYALRRSMTSGTANATSVAVLPFEWLSADSENSYLAVGMVEELTTRLAKTPGLRVISRTSSAQFAKGTSIAAIARQLHVGAVVEGSVLASTSGLRVNVQLIDATNESHLWAEAYDRDLGGTVAVCDDAARAIAKTLRPKSPQTANRSAPNARTPRPEAVQAYWKGQYFRRQRLEVGLRKAIVQFEEAIVKDPGFPSAHAALADAYATLGFSGMAPAVEVLPKARQAAEKSLELDSTLAEAYATLGWIDFFYDWNWPRAENNFRRALEINPSYLKAHNLYALGLASRNRFPESIAESDMAIALDPLSFLTSNDAGVILYAAHQYDRAIRRARQTLELQPGNAAAHHLLGVCESGRGRYPAAILEFEKALASSERYSSVLGRLGYACAKTGDFGKARALLAELSHNENAASIHSAFIYVGLRENERAFELLETSERLHEADLVFAGFEPIFDSVRGEPRFVALMKRIGLPAESN